jgi:hypothetical protein
MSRGPSPMGTSDALSRILAGWSVAYMAYCVACPWIGVLQTSARVGLGVGCVLSCAGRDVRDRGRCGVCQGPDAQEGQGRDTENRPPRWMGKRPGTYLSHEWLSTQDASHDGALNSAERKGMR